MISLPENKNFLTKDLGIAETCNNYGSDKVQTWWKKIPLNKICLHSRSTFYIKKCNKYENHPNALSIKKSR